MAASRLCSIPNCNKAAFCRGWCSAHHWRFRKFGDPLAGPPLRNRWGSPVCIVDGCNSPRKRGSGMCTAHTLRKWRHGDPLSGRTPVGEPAKFIKKVLATPTKECVSWPYSRGVDGRPLINNNSISDSTKIVSRIICIAAHGEPPSPAYEAAHSCGNGHLGCVNPLHLRWRTHRQNMQETLIHREEGKGRWAAQ
jgi:hypothetical protein